MHNRQGKCFPFVSYFPLRRRGEPTCSPEDGFLILNHFHRKMTACRCCLTGASPVTASFLKGDGAVTARHHHAIAGVSFQQNAVTGRWNAISTARHRHAVDERFLSTKRFNRRIGCNVTLLTLPAQIGARCLGRSFRVCRCRAG